MYEFKILYDTHTIRLLRIISIPSKLFSSARSRDFDGTPGTELPVSMYTTKTPNRYVPF